MFSNVFKKNHAIYDMMWKILWSWLGHRWQYNMVHCHCMLDTLGYKLHLQYVILIDLVLQQWLDEHTSMVRYMYITYITYTCLFHALFLYILSHSLLCLPAFLIWKMAIVFLGKIWIMCHEEQFQWFSFQGAVTLHSSRPTAL